MNKTKLSFLLLAALAARPPWAAHSADINATVNPSSVLVANYQGSVSYTHLKGSLSISNSGQPYFLGAAYNLAGPGPQVSRGPVGQRLLR